MTFFSSSCVVTFFPPPMHTSGRRQSVCWGPHSSGLEGPLICVPQLHYFTQLPFLNWLYYFTQFTLLNCLYLHSSGLQGPRSSGCSTKKILYSTGFTHIVVGCQVRAPQGAAQGDRLALFFPARLGRVPASSDQVLNKKQKKTSCAPRACACLIRPGTEKEIHSPCPV